MTNKKTYGRTASGVPITDELALRQHLKVA
jgi:hypothetical protein